MGMGQAVASGEHAAVVHSEPAVALVAGGRSTPGYSRTTARAAPEQYKHSFTHCLCNKRTHHWRSHQHTVDYLMQCPGTDGTYHKTGAHHPRGHST